MKTMLKKLLFLLLILPLGALAQSTVTGKVVDQTSNETLVGATVAVLGTNNATFTAFDGTYALKNLKNGDVISVKYLGYNAETTTFQGQSVLNFSLFSSKVIEDVVVVGYGKVKKKDNTGSVTQLTAKDFNKGATPTVENLLNGRVAGVQISTGGGPGSGSAIRIRGGSSLGASNDPLIIVDGLPLSNDTPAGSRNFLATLDPSTVESINVLKDASATSIYGSRASNGVIVITTKKGKKAFSAEYNFQYGSGKNKRQIDVLNAKDFVNYIETYHPTITNQLGIDDPNSSLLDNPATPGVIEGRILSDTNWQNEIYRRTDFATNTLTLNGELLKFLPVRFTVGNTYQEGLVMTDKFNRNTVSIALSPTFFKNYLKVNVNANYSNENNSFAPVPIGDAIRFDPTKPVLNGTRWGGYTEFTNNTGALVNGTRNPVSIINSNNNNGIVNRYFGNFQLDYKFHFLPDLRAVLNVGIDQSKGESTFAQNKFAATAFAANGSDGNIQANKVGSSGYNTSSLTNKLFDGYLNYTKKFGKLDLDATAGYSYQKFEREFFSSGNELDNLRVSDTFTDADLVLLGFFGRTNFAYNDTYLLSLSYRRDGSSRFPTNNKYGNFPAASFAWKINKDLFADSKTINELKLRAGWGITGQQDFGNNSFYIPQYSVFNNNAQYTFGNTPTLAGQPQAYNSLKWEETTTYNAGLDFALFNSRITGGVDAFYKLSDDLIVDAPFPDGANFTNRGVQNIGSLTVKGIEVNLNADVVKTDKFNWNVNVNATKFERRIKDLKNGNNTLVGGIAGGFGGNIQVLSEGFTPNSFYVTKQLYDSNNRPIENAFADLDGNPSNVDRYIYKNSDPDLLLGFQSQMSYKNLDFSFNARASFGNRNYNNINSLNANTGALNNQNTPANIPSSIKESGFSAPYVLSDYYIENASFLRVDNMTVGYYFPNWLEGKAKLRLTLGIQNPNFLLFTKYSGLDPEVFGGIDNTIYPRQEQILFGANIKF